MKPLPFESKYTYYGDEWLDFHDYLQTLSDREGIFLELSLGLGLINPRELAYKTGGKAGLLNRIKCLVELDREEDKSKHTKILESHGLTKLPDPTDNNVPSTTDNMYG